MKTPITQEIINNAPADFKAMLKLIKKLDKSQEKLKKIIEKLPTNTKDNDKQILHD